MNNTVVFISDFCGGREFKLATGLNDIGWNVILLHRNEPYFSDYKSFNKVINFAAFSVDEFLDLINQISPAICHIFTYYNYDVCNRLLASNRLFPVVVDPYDQLSGMFTTTAVTENHFESQIVLEQNCLLNADGICCRNLETQVLKYKHGLKLRNRVLIFDSCLSNKKAAYTKPKRKEDIHIVHSGSVTIEKLHPGRNEGFLWVARKIAESGMNFHLYPCTPVFNDFESDFSEYIQLEKELNGKFHLHKPVLFENLTSELSQYDIGLIGAPPQKNALLQNRTVEKLKYSMGNKIFDYIEAGLPIITNESFKFLTFCINKFGICINSDQLLYSPSPDFDLEKFECAKKNIINAQNYFNASKQAKRLHDFYNNLLSRGSFVSNHEMRNNKLCDNEIIQDRTTSSKNVPAVKYPHIFTIETTLACNLRCPECAIGGGMIERTKAMMGFSQFKIIADKIRPYAEYVYLHIWGEPMLNPDIFRMIRYTAEFAKTNISTNGMNMTPEMAEELILSGVSDILVSIDGVTQAVYEQYRVGGNVEQAFNALNLLVQANVRHGNKTAITPQFVVFQHNQHEMEQFQTICASLGLVPSFKAPYIRNDDSRFACSDFPQFCRPHYSDIPTLQNAMKECQNPRDVFTILVDGSVVVCCHDYAGTTCFGNIFQQEIPEIWGSSSFCRFRDAIFSGNAPKFCQENCMTWFLDKQPASSAATADAAQLSGAPPAMISSKYMINLCCGPIRLQGYVNIDQMPDSDLALDLESELLPFSDGSAETVVCISAINYFSYERGAQIIKDVYRVLAPGGIARFASQDLKLLARKYLDRDRDFYFQKLPNGRDRFSGVTFADKLNEFFYGFYSAEKHCKYVYDYESLARLFEEAGFTLVEQKGFMESRIPGVDRIDNRPEQMFFLEAVKGGEKSTKNLPAYSTPQPVTAPDENFRDLASAAWHNNEPERAWQYLLKALALNPGDRQAMFWCSEILISMDRFLDVCKLYTEYLKVQPNDIEIREMLDKYSSPQCQKDNAELDAIELRQRELVLLNQRTNTIMTDLEHLAASVQWLRKAQEINGRGGVSAVYYMDEARWGVDYPETTGYIIPTFLHYASLTGDDRYRQWAIEMGEWELAIQSPEGGAGEPLGVYGLRPRVFNTGQVLLGWLSLYQATADSKYLNAARKGADWILSCLSPEGAWVHSTYQGPHAYKSRVSWALLELFSVTHEDRYRNGAELSLQWILKQARPNGWFENNSLSEPDKPWTHLIGYVLVGLLEILRIGTARIDCDNLLKLLHNAAKGIITTYRERKKIYINPCAMPATFDPNWGSQDTWSCVTGNAQLEFFLRRLSHFVVDPSLTEVADQVMNDLKQIHLIDGVHDANLYGGIQGSVPIEAPYAIYSIPNWGVKFFADSLLQRLLPFDKIPYLS